MDLRGFLRVLARRWLTVALVTVAGLAAAVSVVALSTPQYQADSQVFVSARVSTSISDMNQGSAFSQARVQSYADIVTSPRVTGVVVQELGLPLSADQLAQQITATVQLNTVLIDISVVDRNPALAATIANAVADEASRQIVSLETPTDDTTAPVRISLTRAATPPTAPISPRPTLDLAGGLLAGLLGGVGLALLRDMMDTTLRTGPALAEATGLPVLGTVPFDRTAPEAPLAVGAVHSARAESIRMVRTNLQFANVDKKPKVLLVTSPLASEGKTSIAANLALSMAETGSRVCLVDADLRSPSVAGTFGLVQDAGLTSVLIDAATLDEVLQPVGTTGLCVLTSGQMPPNPAELLSSERMGDVLDELARCFDHVIVDSAPLLPVADTIGLGSLVDGAVLVVRSGRTASERVRHAVEALRAVGVPVLGAVLSMVQLRGATGYGYGYGYGYGQERTAGAGAGTTVPPSRGSRLRSGATAMVSLLRIGS
ncbi:polysaccharide biosynthesis tyrosine autokinase [Streptacidiphilus rugosus]|uniref:polysaccharide biosynthesis tyrosine autokinase n=1 Tax=Streptacidiphilus rugosus TaxID=405783 RepID=UPI00068B5C05|nr:polysaccharide biosynthesis tyrosine autokinase [Streptacidiphilus rugosus]